MRGRRCWSGPPPHLAESGFGVFAALDEERLGLLGDLLGELRRDPLEA